MTKAKRAERRPEKKPEYEPDDTRTHDISEPVTVTGMDIVPATNDPERLTGGAWLSLGLSVSFYLIMLAIGAKYDSDHRVASKHFQMGHSVLAAPLANVPVSASDLPLVSSVDRSAALLARAHACATLAQWDCVIEATSGVIARRGNTPETKALLAQAVVNGGWVRAKGPQLAPQALASQPLPPAQPAQLSPFSASAIPRTRNTHAPTAMTQSMKRVTRHVHRRHERYPSLRYVSTVHSDYPSYLPDIYRH
jgi:hypothetical protein